MIRVRTPRPFKYLGIRRRFVEERAVAATILQRQAENFAHEIAISREHERLARNKATAASDTAQLEADGLLEHARIQQVQLHPGLPYAFTLTATAPSSSRRGLLMPRPRSCTAAFPHRRK